MVLLKVEHSTNVMPSSSTDQCSLPFFFLFPFNVFHVHKTTTTKGMRNKQQISLYMNHIHFNFSCNSSPVCVENVLLSRKCVFGFIIQTVRAPANYDGISAINLVYESVGSNVHSLQVIYIWDICLWQHKQIWTHRPITWIKIN